MVLLNALVSVQVRAVESETPQVNATAYVDDTGGIACKPGPLTDALKVTAEYATLTGQALNAAK